MTCRNVREALSQAGRSVQERDFFAERFTVEEIRALLGDTPVRSVFSVKSPTVKKLGLDPESLSDDDMLRLMVEEPRLMRRPIVVIDGHLYPGATVKSLAGVLAEG